MAKKKAKQKKDKPAIPMGGYYLANHEKLDRVVNGGMGSGGQLIGGLGPDANPADVLAAYDRIGGLIMNAQGEKMETGSFYDFQKRRPHAKIEATVAKAPKSKGTGVTTENVGDKEDKRKRKKFKSPAAQENDEADDEDEEEESEDEE
jgi:hypothetical protein